MAVLVRPRSWGVTKPPPGATINWGHSLAQGLVGCWIPDRGVSVPNLAGLGDALTFSGSTGYAPSAAGEGLATTSVTNRGGLLSPSNRLQPPKNVTILWRGMMYGAASGTNQPIFHMFPSQSNIGDPYASYGMWFKGPDSIYYMWSSGGNQVASSPNVALSSRYLTPLQFALVMDGDNGLAVGYDGAKRVQVTGPSSGLVTTMTYTNPMLLMGGALAGDGLSATGNCVNVLGAIWNRSLQPSELAWLDVEPYTFINPPAPKILYFPFPVAAAPSGLAGVTIPHSKVGLSDPSLNDGVNVSITGG